MPLFDFICQDCGHAFEQLVMGRDIPTCPECKSNRLEKQMSTFAFRSGGSGGSRSEEGAASSSKCSGCAGGSCSTCH